MIIVSKTTLTREQQEERKFTFMQHCSEYDRKNIGDMLQRHTCSVCAGNRFTCASAFDCGTSTRTNSIPVSSPSHGIPAPKPPSSSPTALEEATQPSPSELPHLTGSLHFARGSRVLRKTKVRRFTFQRSAGAASGAMSIFFGVCKTGRL